MVNSINASVSSAAEIVFLLRNESEKKILLSARCILGLIMGSIIFIIVKIWGEKIKVKISNNLILN